MHNDILSENTPFLDLHGEVSGMVESIVNEFIYDNYLMENDLVVVIHGKSTNILTKEVHRVLKENKYIEDYYLNRWNLGETIIKIKKKTC